MKSVVLGCLLLCAGVALAQQNRFDSGSAVSGNNNFDRFGSGSGSSSNRLGSGSTSDRDFGSSGSSRFGSSGNSGSDRFGSSGSGSSSDRFGSSGSNSDRFGSTNNRDSDRFGSSGSSSDRFGSSNNRDTDRFGSSGTRDSDRFSVGSGSGSRFTDNSDGDNWDSDSDLDSQRIMAWPGGIIPYEISSDISSANSKILKDTLDFVSRRTCVQFVPRGRNDANYTVFQSGNSCSAPIGMSLKRDTSSGSRGSFGSSMPGRGSSSSSRDSLSRDTSIGYRSTVTLADGCFKAKRLARRIMNLLGLPHEMSRPDRDQYVTINPSNIRSGYTNNIKVLSSSSWLPGVLDIPYDLNSVTQYSDSDLAKDKRTWAVKAKSSRVSAKDLGGEDFSEGDMQKINAAYNCRSGSRGSSGSNNSRPRNNF